MREDDLYLSDEYLRRNPGYHAADAQWKATHILNMLMRHAIHPATVREVGCGAGAILKALHDRMPPHVRFEGYEISPVGHELCQHHETERLKFFLEDVAAAEHDPADILLCIDVIEHVADVRAFLKALRRQTRGAIFHIPVELSAYKVLVPGRLLKSTEEFGHIHFFTRDTALDLLRATGYEVLDWFYTQAGADCRQTLEARVGRWPVKLVSLLSEGLAARLFGAHSILVLTR